MSIAIDQSITKPLIYKYKNICRSPIAEAVLIYLIEKQYLCTLWYVDSAALGEGHVDSLPDPRAIQTLRKHSAARYLHRARQIHPSDFVKYDYIFGMDLNNISALKSQAKEVQNSKAKILLLGDYDPQGERIIRDPYNDDDLNGFEQCYQQCMRCCNAFLEQNPHTTG
ncbi:PREDICTED: low molecular weight phosphotyrosine protein phosphatase-like [Nicrophorus vespilloides]|uniref:Low molecular weight phosphotyrosine protein phosphatase n=1 Tax=Nicrophorus vespilloides TaxID=110193 RepID=A0ABM1MFU2_NICVS|nr:PREDICTED: low molecular weight phosphotyrosine protein phosphatase-like [Nicrophorus vespilloides]